MAKTIINTYKNMTGINLNIKKKSEIKTINKELTYSIDKLKNTGFVPTGSWEDEIKITINHCKEWFENE